MSQYFSWENIAKAAVISALVLGFIFLFIDTGVAAVLL